MKLMSDTPEGFVTAAEAAASLGVADRTVVRWCDAGRLPGAVRQEYPGRIGWRWLIPRRAVANARRRARRAEGASA